MNKTAIFEALTTTGRCPECHGDGESNGWWGVFGWAKCGRCKGSGVDPRAVLRAVQAVGLLLERHARERQAEAARVKEPPVEEGE